MEEGSQESRASGVILDLLRRSWYCRCVGKRRIDCESTANRLRIDCESTATRLAVGGGRGGAEGRSVANVPRKRSECSAIIGGRGWAGGGGLAGDCSYGLVSLGTYYSAP
jgi:hypothetical protein